MRFFLSAFGWIPDDPAGHRLRWHYPADAVVDGAYLGLPEWLVVERAPLQYDLPIDLEELQHIETWAITPDTWWDELGDYVTIATGGDQIRLDGVQAARFRYGGTAARIVAIDAASSVPAFDRVVENGETVTIQGAALVELRVLAFGRGNHLEELQVLDLFAERSLPWEPVAEIGVAAALDASLADVVARHGSPRLGEAAWDELRVLARSAQESSPPAHQPDGLTPWEEFHGALGMRWEHATLFGSGWYDGGGVTRPVSPLDRLLNPLGELPVEPATAYRIIDPSGRVDSPSNLAIALNLAAPGLAAPEPVVVEDPVVAVRPPQDPGGETVTQQYVATYGVLWSSSDPGTIGVEVEEQFSNSPTHGDSPFAFRYETRNRDRTGGPSGRVERRVDVTFVDVSLTASATGIDAWDRVSPPSPTSPPKGFILHHQPPPPALASASRDGDQVTLHQLIADEIDADGRLQPGGRHPWVPDRLVRDSGGRVLVLRRCAEPAMVVVTVDHPVPDGIDGTHHVQVNRPPEFDATCFIGGWLSAGRVRVRVDRVDPPAPTGTRIWYRAPRDAWQSPATFGPGPGVLAEDPGAPSLWEEVDNFPADGLPESLVITDPPTPTADGAVTSTYATQVTFMTSAGPIGNGVSVTWLPPTPDVPPPFEVTLLGRDFYDRTLVKVVLVTLAPGRFTLWWAADEWTSIEQFRARATAGLLGDQDATGGVLYDVLPLPLPRRKSRHVTYGLQRVNAAGGQSDFTLQAGTVPPSPG